MTTSASQAPDKAPDHGDLTRLLRIGPSGTPPQPGGMLIAFELPGVESHHARQPDISLRGYPCSRGDGSVRRGDFRDAMRAATQAAQAGRAVTITCSEGRSRSVSLAGAVIAELGETDPSGLLEQLEACGADLSGKLTLLSHLREQLLRYHDVELEDAREITWR